MSLFPTVSLMLRQAKQNSLSATASVAARSLHSAFGRDPSSLSSAFTEKLDLKVVSRIDKRPISLRFRVSSLIELSQLDKAAEISRLAVLEQYRGWDTMVMMCNEIIGAMCKAKRHDDALALYHYFFYENDELDPDVVCFNHIIKAQCDENRVDDAVNLCNRNRARTLPDIDTIRLLTKGLVETGGVYEAHSCVQGLRTKTAWDSVVYSYIIRGYLDLGNHDKAYDLFSEFIHKAMPDCTYGCNRMLFAIGSSDGHKRRSAVDATFVDYWFKQGKEEKAMEIYRSLMRRNRKGEEVLCVATGNTLLEILFDNGKQAEAWDLFNAMITNPKTFDRETFVTMVNACFKLGLFKEALETFKRPELTRSSRCYANIVAKLCDRGMMSEAQDLFAEICSDQYLCPDVATFRSMINGYAMVGRVDDAIEMLKKMVDATLLKFAVHEAY